MKSKCDAVGTGGGKQRPTDQKSSGGGKKRK